MRSGFEWFGGVGIQAVRAKRGGGLTGPNPTDRTKRGTKYHVATTADGIPVACIATAVDGCLNPRESGARHLTA
jgi:hypothetical protein